ncbi:hypothetical protein BDV19DRAFT_386956 [Aspergillus venezuelensis]
MQSCDICRKRKVKCDRRTPCARCTRLRQPCTYTDILRKKGPKFVHSYPTIYTSTPAGLSTSASTSTSTGTLASVSASASGSSEALVQLPVNATIEGLIKEHREFRGFESGSGSGSGMSAASGSGSGSDFDDELELDLDLDLDLDLEFGDVPREQRVRIQQDFGFGLNTQRSDGVGGGTFVGMEGELSLFVETLYPLYPVVDPQELRFEIHFEGVYGASRYALFCSISAAVHAHLASKSSEASETDNEHGNGGRHRDICEQYLHAALQAREQSDSRTFCFLHDKPITLRPWVTLPQLPNTPDKKLIAGFTRQATLFRNLQVDLSGRHTASRFATPVTLSLATEEANGHGHGHEHDDFNPNASAGVPLPLPLAIQNLEYSVTREWLRAKVWRLGIPGAPQEQEKQSGCSSFPAGGFVGFEGLLE